MYQIANGLLVVIFSISWKDIVVQPQKDGWSSIQKKALDQTKHPTWLLENLTGWMLDLLGKYRRMTFTKCNLQFPSMRWKAISARHMLHHMEAVHRTEHLPQCYNGRISARALPRKIKHYQKADCGHLTKSELLAVSENSHRCMQWFQDLSKTSWNEDWKLTIWKLLCNCCPRAVANRFRKGWAKVQSFCLVFCQSCRAPAFERIPKIYPHNLRARLDNKPSFSSGATSDGESQSTHPSSSVEYRHVGMAFARKG